MKPILLALSALAFCATGALACTPEDVQAKAGELSTQLQELAMKDPVKAGEVAQRMAELQTGAVATSNDLAPVCSLYDEMLAEMAAL